MTKFEFQPFDKVLVRDHEGDEWSAQFFSHYGESINSPYRVLGGIGWAQCIPYNETTKHLCGTSDPYIDPTEAPAFEFGDVVENTITKVRGIFSRNDPPDGAEVFWKGSITTTTCDLDDLRLIRKGNFND
jgi:hypothetical protein